MASDLHTWEYLLISTIGDLFPNGHLLTFEQLNTKHDLPRGQFLTYAQLSNTCHILWRTRDEEPQTHSHLNPTEHGTGQTFNHMALQSYIRAHWILAGATAE